MPHTRKTLPKFYDPSSDLLQCQECKKWFKGLNSHLPRIHKMTGEEYKEKYSLWNGDLVIPSSRQKLSEAQKRPHILKKTIDRFYKNEKMGIARGQRKARYKNMVPEQLLTEESKIKSHKALNEFWKSESGKDAIQRAREKRKKGKEITCLECRNKFYISKYRFENAKFCSRSCKDKSELGKIAVKIAVKNFWQSDKAEIEKEKRRIRVANEWNTGKRKGGWKWHQN